MDVDGVHGYGCSGSAGPAGIGKWDLDIRLNWGSNGDQVTTNNGNLYQQIENTCNGTGYGTAANYTLTYGYDKVNRITSYQDTGAGSTRQFGYDAYGNMWVSSPGSNFPSFAYTPTSNIYSASNRRTDASYDSAGNQVTIPNLCTSTNCIQYDAENVRCSMLRTNTPTMAMVIA